MFENLTSRLGRTLSALTGKTVLTEDNLRDVLREVRMALLEADVALPVVTDFIEQVRNRAIGQEVTKSLSPGQTFIGIVNAEMTRVMGAESVDLDLAVKPPAVLLMAGLQGAGKTTSTAKLALYLKQRLKKKVLMVSADVYRPAAIEQLMTLAEDIGVECLPSTPQQQPLDIAREALAAASRQFADVLIVDTAGRLAVDDDMMAEIRDLHGVLSPAETLFVVDAMTGQDAANTARAFADVLPLTGVILTKVDGDARGGAALSVRQVAGCPIKFLAVGEKADALEVFHPDRIVSRILGMGDVMSLIEEAERKIDRKKADRLKKKLEKGKKFDLVDFRDQLQQMKNMGGMASMLEKLPGLGQMAEVAQNDSTRKMFVQMEAIINSMTPKERRFPDSIQGSRKKRIALGSGTQIQDVNRVLKQHKQMAKMMTKLSKKGGMANMMRGLGGLGGAGMAGGGGMPPGMPKGLRRR